MGPKRSTTQQLAKCLCNSLDWFITMVRAEEESFIIYVSNNIM
jgi:hypothetical protein